MSSVSMVVSTRECRKLERGLETGMTASGRTIVRFQDALAIPKVGPDLCGMACPRSSDNRGTKPRIMVGTFREVRDFSF